MNANGLYSGVEGYVIPGTRSGVGGGVANGVYPNEILLKTQPILDGLVLYLDASTRISGNIWIDLTGNSNGILINNPTYDILVGNAPGLICNNNGIIVPHVPAHLNPVSTISIWFWTNVSFGGDRVWVIKGSSNVGGFTHYLYEPSANLAQYFYASFTPSNNFSNSSVNNGRWNNIVLSYDGANFILYLNGVQIGTQARTTTATVTGALGINGDPNGTINSLAFLASTKKYNQVLMYNRALAANEILFNYNKFKSRFNL